MMVETAEQRSKRQKEKLRIANKALQEDVSAVNLLRILHSLVRKGVKESRFQITECLTVIGVENPQLFYPGDGVFNMDLTPQHNKVLGRILQGICFELGIDRLRLNEAGDSLRVGLESFDRPHEGGSSEVFDLSLKDGIARNGRLIEFDQTGRIRYISDANYTYEISLLAWEEDIVPKLSNYRKRLLRKYWRQYPVLTYSR